MHKNLRKLLHAAEGHSEHVVVIFLDVRGFSSFAKIAESSDAAEFLTSAYSRIVDRFFGDAAFLKLTGDGMLVLYKYDRESLTHVVRRSLDLSFRLLDVFPTITKGDPMINFQVPRQLGIGIARGAATRISSGHTVLDYSGRPLNLAARLMDLARPSGIVIDESLGIELLTKRVRSRFERDAVYVRGIAETEATPVYFLPGRTKIPEDAKRPLHSSRFTEEPEEYTLAELRELGRFRHRLTYEPATTDDIELHLAYPTAQSDGSRHPSLLWMPSYPASYGKRQGNHYAKFNYDEAVANIEANNVDRDDWPIEVTVEYSIRLDTSDPAGVPVASKG